MKKTKMKNRLLLFSCMVCGMMLSGCTDGDYKISSVDAQFGVGNGNLKLPSNSSFVVTLDDILDLGSTDLITIDETTGNYEFGKDPETVTDVNVKINRITSTGSTNQVDFPALNLPDAVRTKAGQTVKPADLGEKLEQKGLLKTERSYLKFLWPDSKTACREFESFCPCQKQKPPDPGGFLFLHG